MKLSEITLGTIMQIELRKLLLGEDFVMVKARVLGFDENEMIILEQPSFKGLPVPFVDGTMVKVFFLKSERHFGFEAEFIEFARVESMRGIKLRPLGTIQEIQRRNYFRLKSMSSVKIGLVSRDGFDTRKITHSESFAYDISGGGMRLIVDDTYQTGDRIECIIGVLDGEIKVQADIVWKNTSESEQKNKCQIGVRFDFVTETLREELIRYIFEEQRRFLRKEGKIGII